MKEKPFITKSRTIIKIWAIFGGAYMFGWFLQAVFGAEIVGYSNILVGEVGSFEWTIDLFNMTVFLFFSMAMIHKLGYLKEGFKYYKKRMDLNNEKSKVLVKKMDQILWALIVVTGMCWLGGFMHRFDMVIFFILLGLQFTYCYLFKKIFEMEAK